MDFLLNNDTAILYIFSYMKTRKLHNIAVVCKKWEILVNETIANRKKRIPFQMTLFQEGNWKFTHSPNKQLRDVEIEKESFSKEFNKSLIELGVKPSLYIYFLTSDFFNYKYNTLNQCIIKSPSFQINQKDHPEINRRKNVAYAAKSIFELLPKDDGSLKLCLAVESFIFTDLKEYNGN